MKKILIPLIHFYVIGGLFAQDFDQFPTLSGNLEGWYDGITENSETPLMNGIYYYDEKEEFITQYHTPFYKTGWDYFGKVTYDGRFFPRVNIIYNTSEDLLLFRNAKMEKEGEKSILIDQSKIDSFSIHNDKFLRFDHAKIGENGFYKVVMRGENIECLVKEVKTGQPAGLVYEFNGKSNIYIRFKGEVHSYRQRASLYKIFPDQKKEIKRYIREYSLFTLSRKDRESFLTSVLSYCDSIVE